MTVAPSLIAKIINGGIWSFSLRIASRGIGLVKTLVLARLLFPEDFGQIGLIMTVVTLVDSLTQTGFSQALIHRGEPGKRCLDAVWTASMLRSSVLFLFLVAIAPVVAELFEIDGLESLMRAVAVSTLIGGFSSISVVLFQKMLDFRRFFFLEAISAFADLVVSISLAFYLRNAWALVIGGMTLNLCRLMLSYLLHPYRPGFCVQWQELRPLFGFGKWVFVASLLITTITQGDSLFIAKTFGAVAVGYYQMAFLITNLISVEITNTVSQMVFPSYSLIRGDAKRIRDGFMRVFELIVVLCIPIAAGIYVLSGELTSVFLGPKWIALVPLIKIMCVLGPLRAFGGTAISLFWGCGVPIHAAKGAFIQLLFLASMIGPFSAWMGLEGATAAVVGSYLVLEIVYARFALGLVGAGWTRLARSLAGPGLASAAMVWVVSSLKGGIPVGALGLCLLSAVGAGCYAFFLLAIDALASDSRIRLMFSDLLNSARRSTPGDGSQAEAIRHGEDLSLDSEFVQEKRKHFAARGNDSFV